MKKYFMFWGILFTLTFSALFVNNPFLAAQNTEKAKSFYEKGRKAYLRFTIKDYEESVKFYQKALNADSNYAPAYAGLAEAYASWGYELERSGKAAGDCFDKALHFGRKAVFKDSSSDVAYRGLAMAYMNADAKKYGEEAYRALLTALSLDTTDAETFYLLWMHTQNDNPESPFIQKSIALNPDYFLSHYALAVAWSRKKNYDKAAEYYKQCVRINPDHELPYYGLGTTYSQMKKHSLSIPEYEKALKINPDHVECYLYLGLAYYYTEKDRDAVKYLEKYLKLNPNSSHKTTVENILRDIKK